MGGSQGSHRHKCGHSHPLLPYCDGDPDPKDGCGYVWEYGNENARNMAAHDCPKCGLGPWVVHYRGDAQ